MDATVEKRGARRELAAAVRASSAAAVRILELLRGEADLDSENCFRKELARACAAWPVEGGGAEEVLKTTALLVVLRQIVERCSGEEGANWRLLEIGCDGSQRLANLAGAAEALPSVASAIATLNGCLPVDLPRIVRGAAAEVDAVLPLSVFYEQLLARFDRGQRAARGVYHTPRPVVRWMVEGVRGLIDQEFQSASQLRFVDMGCGCGSFLGELTTMLRGQWLSATRQATFVGYEVLPSAYAMANWLLCSGSSDCGGDLEIRWANPLLRGDDERSKILAADALPILIGNPPYSNFGRSNRGRWIDGLLQNYKQGLGERKINLGDDFIKFIRWGQHWIDQAGQGILAVVTSSTYLTGLTHRRMRELLLESFDHIYILDLHGSGKGPDAFGDNDENVFDVRSGVAVGLFVKRKGGDVRPARVNYCSIRGARSRKLSWLDDTPACDAAWQQVKPHGPMFLFTKHSKARSKQASHYSGFWPLTRIFEKWISGVQTKNDALFVDFDRTVLADRIAGWLGASPKRGEETTRPQFDERFIQPYMVAPLDRRWIYYDPRLIGRARYEVMRHMLQPNIGLVFMRQSTNAGDYDHFLAVDCLVSDRVFYSRHGAPFLAPLWLDTDGNDQSSDTRRANYANDWIGEIERRTGELPAAASVFDYIYASTHRSAYRQRFSVELRLDFPRIPLPEDGGQFHAFALAGRRLRELHIGLKPATSAPESLSDAPTFIGGYDVLKRWRKPRKGREPLSGEPEYEDRLRRVLAETRQLRANLDGLG